MTGRALSSAFFLVALLVVPTASAQAPATQEVLALVPDDMALCLVVQDLRGVTARFAESPWHKMLHQTPLGQTLLASPEMTQLAHLKETIAKHLQTSWPRLRDDVLGDAIVLAFRPGAKPEEEYGLILLKARDAKLLADLVERLNKAQKQSGDLTELAEVEHRNVKYVRRTEGKRKHFYLLDGSLLAVSGTEEVIQRVIEIRAKERKPATAGAHLVRAGAAKAFLALWVNPRALDADLRAKLKNADPFEGHALKHFLSLWDAFDGFVVALTPERELQISLSVVARKQALPDAARRFFNQANKPSDLWQRFPEDALISFAGRFDAAALVDALIDMTPPPLRKIIGESLQGTVGSSIGLDLLKDVVPNLGPDWGVCVAPSTQADEFPHMITALAVRPGEKDVDRAVAGGLHAMVFQGVLLYNTRNRADPILFKRAQQGKVEVHYLAHAKLFPAGVQPAFALKDGYLLVASSPEAIARFKKGASPTLPPDEAPLLRISVAGAAKLLAQHRAAVAAFLAQKNQIPPQAAGQMLDGLLAALAPFDRLLLSQRAGDGQISWILRVSPGKLE